MRIKVSRLDEQRSFDYLVLQKGIFCLEEYHHFAHFMSQDFSCYDSIYFRLKNQNFCSHQVYGHLKIRIPEDFLPYRFLTLISLTDSQEE